MFILGFVVAGLLAGVTDDVDFMSVDELRAEVRRLRQACAQQEWRP